MNYNPIGKKENTLLENQILYPSVSPRFKGFGCKKKCGILYRIQHLYVCFENVLAAT